MSYIDNGITIYNEQSKSWAVQIDYSSGPGVPFRTIKWATWKNPHYYLGLQETNESNMRSWRVATDVDIILYCGNMDVIKSLKDIRALVRLGYKGAHRTDESLMADIEWRMNG